MSDEVKDKIRQLLAQPLRDEGCEIADMVVSKYKNNTTLRLFVYCQNGTTIDECARLSRIVGDLVDGTDLFTSGYTLEVSSPGLDRPLKTAQDFRFRVGETVKIEFVDPKRKKLTAEIVAATVDEVEFSGEDGPFKVGLTEIDKAKIIF
ncbi:MAG: ribosome maturation factor RimP [Candidatus Zixiibacteriota bacterium]|nr:MAG: ribosome maturation factor RimP [candidate division Zixibacteria bacterium]